MQDLIKRLEAAEKGSRAFDFEFEKIRLGEAFPSNWRLSFGCVVDDGGIIDHAIPHYTTNLQDAVDAIPEGWRTSVAAESPSGQWSWGLYNEMDRHVATEHWHASPALALCIAILKTLE